MSPHIPWSQVWASLRPQLLKLARRPVVWLAGSGLLVILAFNQWMAWQAPVASVTLLPGQETQPDLFGGASLAVSITIKLALVIALIYVCMFLLRKWQGGWWPVSRKRVSLLETTRLSPRQALHLVQVGDRTLLVGATDQTVTLLTEVSLPPEAETAPAKTQAASPAFAAALDQALNQAEGTPLAPQRSSRAC